MYPFRRILIPTDFSTASEWVFDDAVRVAAAHGGELVILHIRMTRSDDPSRLRFPADPSLYEYAEQYELERLRSRIERAHETLTTRLVVKQAPKAGPAICETATEEQADLIVISTHARHHIAHFLVGSTTLEVITSPPAPVLAIRYGTRKRESMKKMVVPVHLKQTSHAALEFAAKIAADEQSEVHLLTVCPDSEKSNAERMLDELIGASLAGINARRAIVRGSDIEREVVRYTDKIKADVVFLNAKQELSEAKIDIIRHVPAPVMVVP